LREFAKRWYNFQSKICGGVGMKTLAYGFPKLGEKREFKSLLENFWKGKIDESQFVDGMNNLRRGWWKTTANVI
jgi:methionine synthase (B12-independent) (EC 2.1.1.14)